MKGDADSDVSMNDADNSANSGSEAHFDSFARHNEKGETTTAVLGHELVILQDPDVTEDDYNIIEEEEDDDTTSKKLCLLGDGENWLHIRSSSAHQIQDCTDKKNVATGTFMRPSEEDEKKEDQLASTGKREIEKSNQGIARSTQIMQTQEPSPTQKTLSQTQTQPQTQLQIQTQPQTQEVGTQQSVEMSQSLLAYLNQPSQDVNEAAARISHARSIIEIISGAELSALGSKPSSSSPLQYPPNASTFLCFEELLTPGATQRSCLTVKDMRPPQNLDKTSKAMEGERDITVEIDLLRANREVSVGWKPLPRRKLTTLSAGDRMRIIITPPEAIHPQNRPFANIAIVLEYRRAQTSTKQIPNRLQSSMVETHLDAKDDVETDSNFDMIVDGASQNTECHQDKHLNTFVGTIRRGAAKVIQPGKDVMSSRNISSNPSDFQNTFDGTESVIDSNASIAVDSTVNLQQESLRSSRMKLLKHHPTNGKNINDKDEGIQNKNVRNKCDPSGEKENCDNVQKDLVENKAVDNSSEAAILGDNNLETEDTNLEKESKASCKNGQNNLRVKEDNVSSDATTLNHNNLEPEDVDSGKNSNGRDLDRANESSFVSNPHCYTQETCDPSVDQTPNGEHESDDSSGATVPIYYTQDYTQEEGLADVGKNPNGENEEEGQTKTNTDRDTTKEDNFMQKLRNHPTNDTENIPRSIEIGDDDNEDVDRPPVSQLLLSMETDNEGDENREDENQLQCNTQEKKEVTTAQQNSQAYNMYAESAPNKPLVSNIETKSGLEPSSAIEKQASEGSHQKASNKTDITPCVQEEIIESKGDATDPSDAVANGVKKVFDNAGNSVATDTKVENNEESDDETILGTDVIMHNTIHSSITRDTGMKSGEGNSSSVGDNLEEKMQTPVDHEGIDGAQPEAVDKAQESDSTALSKENKTQNQVESTVQEVVDTADNAKKEAVQPHMALRSRRKRKILASKSAESEECEENLATSTMDSDRRRKIKSSCRAITSPEDGTSSNQGALQDTPQISSGPTKRRRTLTSKKDDSNNDLIDSRAAKKLYKKRVEDAIENKTVNIVISGFKQNEMVRINKLCRTKFLNVNQLKINESIDDTTTLCILPTAVHDSEEASCRTLKAIRCALLGIPMVSLEWLERCEKERKIKIPTSYIWTLSSNIGTVSMRNSATNGVARLAAARCREPENPPLPFQNTFVFLCGKYSVEKKNGILKLLKEGSANLLSSSREASAKLESIMVPSQKSPLPPKRFVLLVGDRGTSIPRSLRKQIAAALEDDKSGRILVVDSNWVGISIACASMLPPDNFKPKEEVDLWRQSKKLPE